MENKEKIVYWAPVFFDDSVDWNMMYYDLPSLQDYLRPSMAKTDPSKNLFYCPAVSNITKNTFLVINPIETHCICNGNEIGIKSKNYLTVDIDHEPSITDNILLAYGMHYVFFTEEDLTLSITSPYFTQSDYMKYAALVPGKFKINSWFRAINLEFNLWGGNREFHVKKEEVLAYINFNTDDKIKLVRFNMNKELHKYLNSCGSSSSWESFIPLVDRYKRFKQTHMQDLILKEIKKNIV
jgi:mRNA-degrading endonuclease YafQ of YafQ-DinJ toxin-antitoxin module